MTPPDNPQLCEFPENIMSTNSNWTFPLVLQSPLALLVSLGGCDVYTKTDVALQINEKISQSLRYIVFYNNDPDDNDGIVQILSPPNDSSIVIPENIERLAFLSISTSAGVNLMSLIQKYSEATGRGAQFLQDGSEYWDLAMVVERLGTEQGTPPPPNSYSSSSNGIQGGNFFWFRLILFALLIMSPCCRGAYLWYNGGGRIRFRRNENGRIIGLQYISPMSYWFAPNGTQVNSQQIAGHMTEEEVLALPEIVYKGSPDLEPKGSDAQETKDGGGGDENEDDDDVPTLIDSDIVIRSGSADGNEQGDETTAPRAPIASESFREDIDHPEYDNLVTSCTTCSICIEEFEVGERLRLLPRCKHAFHTECIMPWLTERQGCCPLCKAKVLESEGDEGDQGRGRDVSTDADPTIQSQDDITEQSAPITSDRSEAEIRLSTRTSDATAHDGVTRRIELPTVPESR